MSQKDNLTQGGIIKKITFAVASMLGIGFVPKASGTVASLATLPIAWLLLLTGGAKGLLIGTLVFTLIGYFFTHLLTMYVEAKDPSYVVVDELIGQLITFILPAMFFYGTTWSPFFYLCGFVLFRIFDIVKPWHVGWADEYLNGALGIITDDVIAGVYSSILLTIIMFIYGMFVNHPVPM